MRGRVPVACVNLTLLAIIPMVGREQEEKDQRLVLSDGADGAFKISNVDTST